MNIKMPDVPVIRTPGSGPLIVNALNCSLEGVISCVAQLSQARPEKAYKLELWVQGMGWIALTFEGLEAMYKYQESRRMGTNTWRIQATEAAIVISNAAVVVTSNGGHPR